jgi:tetratricopeptide (TPR) repeat protein
MKFFLLFLCVCLAAFTASAQPARSKPPIKKPSSQTTSKKPAVAKSTPKKSAAKPSEKDEFDKAIAIEDKEAKVDALKKFIAAFPDSPSLVKAKVALTTTAYGFAEENLSVGEVETAVAMYRLAIETAPSPLPTDVFNDSLAKVLTSLHYRGNRAEALDLAKTLESKSENKPEMLAALSTFYASIENGDEAVRLAEAAVKADPVKSKSYVALGTALRVNFRLEDSATAFAKALELDPTSVLLKRSLAEIKRAIGKSDEAIALYRDALTADENDQQSRSGLVLALFDSGKTEDAEREFAKAIETNPNNIMLIAGVAYWYAAHKNGDKAVELAQKAIAIEPRYVWSHIALGRGLMLQNRAPEAEEVLLKAKQYGNFATLDYEIASARFMAGFYRDAVEGLQNSFSLNGDEITTKVGARVSRTGTNFTDILADERRASILEPTAADDADAAARLKQLMIVAHQLSSATPDEASVVKAADAFVAGDDQFKYHRQLYAASLLLNKKIAVDKALEYAEAAVGNADAALAAPNANAYVMASELYDSRQLAMTRGELIKVPDVPRQTLAAILRGRIEDLIGWALLQKEKPTEAAIHFKRAVSILPEKSAWWRAGLWRLGSALQADGKDQEALDAYIKSYSIDKPDLARYTTVEMLYKKVNGSDDGLEAKIGAIPLAQIPTTVISKTEPTPSPAPNTTVPEPSPTPATQTDANSVSSAPPPAVIAEPSPTPAAQKPAASTEQNDSQTLPALKIEALPTPAAAVESTDTKNSLVQISPAAASPSPSPEATVTPAAVEKQDAPTPELKITPTPSTVSTPTSSPEPSQPVEASSTAPMTQTTATPAPEPTPVPTPTPEVKIEPAAVESETTPVPIPAASATPDERTVADVSKKTDIDEIKKESPRPPPSSSPKPLFEPIIITIPKSDIPRSSSTTAKVERPTLDIDRSNPDTRPRVIVSEPIQASEPSPCQISVSQEKLSLLNNGGTLSVLVGVDRNGTLGDIKYVVSDPADISVSLETDVTDMRGRSLYVIRSISERTGSFRVTFYLSCGKRDLQVTVR